MKKISEDKFFPDNPKWKEPYITYLGSIVKDGNEYDLGIWKSPKSTDMSWFFAREMYVDGKWVTYWLKDIRTDLKEFIV